MPSGAQVGRHRRRVPGSTADRQASRTPPHRAEIRRADGRPRVLARSPGLPRSGAARRRQNARYRSMTTCLARREWLLHHRLIRIAHVFRRRARPHHDPGCRSCDVSRPAVGWFSGFSAEPSTKVPLPQRESGTRWAWTASRVSQQARRGFTSSICSAASARQVPPRAPRLSIGTQPLGARTVPIDVRPRCSQRCPACRTVWLHAVLSTAQLSSRTFQRPVSVEFRHAGARDASSSGWSLSIFSLHLLGNRVFGEGGRRSRISMNHELRRPTDRSLRKPVLRCKRRSVAQRRYRRCDRNQRPDRARACGQPGNLPATSHPANRNVRRPCISAPIGTAEDLSAEQSARARNRSPAPTSTLPYNDVVSYLADRCATDRSTRAGVSPRRSQAAVVQVSSNFDLSFAVKAGRELRHVDRSLGESWRDPIEWARSRPQALKLRFDLISACSLADPARALAQSRRGLS